MKKNGFVLSLVVLVVIVSAVTSSVLADGPVEGRAGRAELRFLEGMIDHHQMALDMADDCLINATTESVQTVCQNIVAAQSAEIEMMQGWLLSWYNVQYSAMSMNDSGGAGTHTGAMPGMMGMEMSDEMHAHMEAMHGMMDMMMGMEMSDEMRAHMEAMHGMMGMMMPGQEESATEEADHHAGHGEPETASGPFTDPAMSMGMMAGLNRLQGVDYDIAFLEAMVDHHDDALHMAERLLARASEGTGHAELRALAQQIIEDQTAEIEAMEQLITELSA